jgi:hypothetical protein
MPTTIIIDSDGQQINDNVTMCPDCQATCNGRYCYNCGRKLW